MATGSQAKKHGRPLRIAVLVGSLRAASNTRKAAFAFAAQLSLKDGVAVDLIDPRALDLLVPGREGQEAKETAVNGLLRARVSTCHGVAFVTPEYDGSYSAITKLLIECLGYPSILAGKPVTVLGVASGRIGAVRAIDHLRGVLFNIGALVMPTSPSFAQVHKTFDAHGVCVDEGARQELAAAALELETYARVFSNP